MHSTQQKFPREAAATSCSAVFSSLCSVRCVQFAVFSSLCSVHGVLATDFALELGDRNSITVCCQSADNTMCGVGSHIRSMVQILIEESDSAISHQSVNTAGMIALGTDLSVGGRQAPHFLLRGVGALIEIIRAAVGIPINTEAIVDIETVGNVNAASARPTSTRVVGVHSSLSLPNKNRRGKSVFHLIESRCASISHHATFGEARGPKSRIETETRSGGRIETRSGTGVDAIRSSGPSTIHARAIACGSGIRV